MHRALIGLFILPVGLLCGCGGGAATPSKFTTPPHGGNIVDLPDARGFVELRTDHGAPSKSGRNEKEKSRIVAYFYEPDATTAMSPPPTDVQITLGNGSVIKLTSNEKTPGEFASEPGTYPDELRGQIELQVDGKPTQATFSFR